MTTTTAPPVVDVAVIGAGIGGLSSVLALRAAGVDAHVFERTPKLAPIGAAILVRVQSLEVIKKWADMDYYDSRRVHLDTMEVRKPDGTPVTTWPVFGEPDDPGWGHMIHRADLFECLRRALPGELEGDPRDKVLHLGCESVGITQNDDHAEVRFADGTSVRARAVIGADGIRSKIRDTLFDLPDPVFSGMVNFRAVAPAKVLGELPNDRARLYVGDGNSFWTWPISGGDAVGYDAAIWVEEVPDWGPTVDSSQVLSHFTEYLPLVGDMVRAGADQVSAHTTFERQPQDRWSVGRVTLLGDAAHAMLPFQGQGANQAVQDADELATHLAPAILDDTSVPVALQAYEDVRRPFTRYLQEKSRDNHGLDDPSSVSDETGRLDSPFVLAENGRLVAAAR